MNPLEKAAEKFAQHVSLEGERTRDAVRAGVAGTNAALRLRGARNRPIYANSLVWGDTGRLVGFSLRESSGSAPATVTWYDSHDAGGDLVATASLPAGGSVTHWFGPGGVSFGDGLFVAVTGAVAGTTYLGAVD